MRNCVTVRAERHKIQNRIHFSLTPSIRNLAQMMYMNEFSCNGAIRDF